MTLLLDPKLLRTLPPCGRWWLRYSLLYSVLSLHMVCQMSYPRKSVELILIGNLYRLINRIRKNEWTESDIIHKSHGDRKP